MFTRGIGLFHYIRSIMKKTLRSLFLVALLFTVAGAFAASCQKGGDEEDVPEVGASRQPSIKPGIAPSGKTYVIKTDGTIISLTSSGYSFFVQAVMPHTSSAAIAAFSILFI